MDSGLFAAGKESKVLAVDQVSAILKRYSDGKSTPEETLKTLGLDYGTLLVMLFEVKFALAETSQSRA